MKTRENKLSKKYGSVAICVDLESSKLFNPQTHVFT